ncbi:hypothetical protein T10_3940 [Trichinella papuae]|uniref:Uncharacterized protein n=1 Tax=Trichinella papuae TaxID=268474 RepID=A0A0V1MFN9_9BILA|nr:hypothetical protein T10_3940 [Trichinella papuae]
MQIFYRDLDIKSRENFCLLNVVKSSHTSHVDTKILHYKDAINIFCYFAFLNFQISNPDIRRLSEICLFDAVRG